MKNLSYQIIVDPELRCFVMCKHWFQNTHGNLMCKVKGKNVYLVEFILPFVKSLDVDHINRNIFDNRKLNLRLVTRKANLLNHGKYNINRSSGSYCVQLCRGGYVGRFQKWDDAVSAYRIAHYQVFTQELEKTREHNPHLTDEQYYYYAE